MEKEIKRQLDIIKRGTVEIIQEKGLAEKIKKSLEKKKPLVIKAGFDPTAPDIHLGHTVLLRKLRHFQDLGHKVIFLIGDATALVGDPSGHSLTRKIMTWEEVQTNAITYEKQVSKILNTRDSNLFLREHNSRWFSRHGYREQDFPPFTFEQFVELAQRYTVARLLERDDFQKRLKENKPISFLELFYPLMQGYDSIMIARNFGSCDIEIGGTDQKFNMLVGRDLQQAPGYREEQRDQGPQVVITMPLLEGTDGVQKMSKSLGNYIGINEPPKDMFGKVMSISDSLMWRYYELLTDKDYKKLKEDVTHNQLHPKQAKIDLAKGIVSFYYGTSEAEKAEKEFEQVFKNKQVPESMPIFETDKEKIGILELLKKTNFASSTSAAARLVQQGAVSIDGVKVTDIKAKVDIKDGSLLKAGKLKFIKIFRPIL